jgi:hypothetical protein
VSHKVACNDLTRGRDISKPSPAASITASSRQRGSVAAYGSRGDPSTRWWLGPNPSRASRDLASRTAGSPRRLTDLLA